jgi:hypothetical protein
VALGEGRFEPREVTLGLDSGDGWLEIRSGLREGERIVTSGQFLIDSESRLREAIEKMMEPEGGSPGAAETTAPDAAHDHGGHPMPGMEAAPDPMGHDMPPPEG